MSPRPLLDGFQDAHPLPLRVLEDLLEPLIHPELGLHRRLDAVLCLRSPHQMDGHGVAIENCVVRPVKALVDKRCRAAADVRVPLD